MKILHVGSLYYPSLGGNQQHLQALSEKLLKLKEDVTVFTSNALSPHQFISRDPHFTYLPEEELINGVRVRRFKVHYAFRSFFLIKCIKFAAAIN